MTTERTELTNKEMERLDFVDNTIHQMICELAGREIEWDTEAIGDISDIVEELVCDKLKIMPDYEFAPYIEESAPDSRDGDFAAAAESVNKSVRVLILLDGGLVQDVMTDKPGIEVAVLDADIEGADEEFDEIVDVTGDGYALRGTLQAHDVAIAPEAIESAWRPAEPDPQHAR